MNHDISCDCCSNRVGVTLPIVWFILLDRLYFRLFRLMPCPIYSRIIGYLRICRWLIWRWLTILRIFSWVRCRSKFIHRWGSIRGLWVIMGKWMPLRSLINIIRIRGLKWGISLIRLIRIWVDWLIYFVWVIYFGF